jgi:hypothetical protein
MITKHWNAVSFKIVVGVFLLILGSCVKSYAEKVEFLISNVVPAARGYVKIKKDSNKNFAIEIKIRNLAEVKRLTPSRETYVIWMVTEKGGAENIGRLKSSSGFLSNKLKATFSTTISSKPTKIYITAEDNPAIEYSLAKEVLSTATL